MAQITTVYNEVEKALSGALEAVKNKDINLATTVRAMKQNVSEVSHKAGQQSFNSVRAQNGGGVLQYVREAELIEILDGIFKTARRIARSELQNAETTSY